MTRTTSVVPPIALAVAQRHGPLVGLAVVLLLIIGCASAARGVVGGHLASCDGPPHGVSSQSMQANRTIPPWPAAGGVPVTQERLLQTLRGEPRLTVLDNRGPYLHAIVTSAVFGFTDDLEFLCLETKVEVRSCARSGYWDFGVNRGRLERLRNRYLSLGPITPR